MTQTVRESLRDHQGQMKDLTWKSFSKTEYGMQNGKEIAMSVQPVVNMYHPRARLYAEVTESCSQNYQTKDSEGKDVTATRRGSITWKCEIRGLNLPQEKGASKSYGCVKDGGMDAWNNSGDYSDSTAKDMIMKRNRKISMDLKLSDIKTVFKEYFDSCAGKSDDKAIQLNLAQGVQGRMMERDFRFYVSINGGQELEFKRPSGLLSDDIKFCPENPNSPIDVKIRVVKKGWIWDAKYTTEGVHLDKPYSSGHSQHTRQTLFRNPGFKSTIAIQRKPFLAQPGAVLPMDGSGGVSASW